MKIKNDFELNNSNPELAKTDFKEKKVDSGKFI